MGLDSSSVGSRGVFQGQNLLKLCPWDTRSSKRATEGLPDPFLSFLSHLFQTWLRSYIKLFQALCQHCGKFLQDGLPPTWRDFRTLEAFHDTCRQ